MSVDVSTSCDLEGPLRVAATAILPTTPDMTRGGATVVYALPGGGYSRGYYDMHFAGHPQHSQAEHHADRGLVFVAIDHLGVGDSTPETCGIVRLEDIALANHAAVEAISKLIEDGVLTDGSPPVQIARRIGIGQSMGGAVTIAMAATHGTYDAIAVLGFSAIHTVLPFPSPGVTGSVAKKVGSNRRDEDPATQSVDETTAMIPDFLYPFFWSDVPAAIVDADTHGGYPLRATAPPFGSLTLPNCAVAMLSPGYIAKEAAAVRCPVFIGLGERDTAVHPHSEPAAYEKCSDATLFICETMAHMHNFASTRRQLWDRLAGWYANLPSTHPRGAAG